MSHTEDQDSSSSGEDCESPTFAKKYGQSDTDVSTGFDARDRKEDQTATKKLGETEELKVPVVQEEGSLRKEEDHSIHLQVNKKGTDLRQV